jgi:hypothetical protein
MSDDNNKNNNNTFSPPSLAEMMSAELRAMWSRNLPRQDQDNSNHVVDNDGTIPTAHAPLSLPDTILTSSSSSLSFLYNGASTFTVARTRSPMTRRGLAAILQEAIDLVDDIDDLNIMDDLCNVSSFQKQPPQ